MWSSRVRGAAGSKADLCTSVVLCRFLAFGGWSQHSSLLRRRAAGKLCVLWV